MLAISNITKTFHQGKLNEVKALKELSLELNSDEFLIIVGANGSGKSTLLNTVCGNVLPDAGSITIDDNNVTKLEEHQRSRWIARVFQNPLSGTASDLTVLENFRLASLRTKKKDIKIGITESFKNQVRDKISLLRMGLEDKINQPMGTLSGGQRQALTLLMAVMDDVKVLLLDEPTAALDPRSADTVMQTANQLIADYNLTAILITHNMKEAFNYGNRIIQMAEGEIIRDLNTQQKSELSHTDLYEWFM